MAARLVISDNVYTLSTQAPGDWIDLATLPGGPTALFPAGSTVNEAGLEAAIEIAEDWLMPHAKLLQGEVLTVHDAAGAVTTGVHDMMGSDKTELTLLDIEHVFLRLVDLATGRGAAAVQGQQRMAAGIVLLRELAQHGRLLRVDIDSAVSR